MQFHANDPGCVRYGNFINYYSFNSAENRIQLLPAELWEESTLQVNPHVVLDIGCNSGELTQLLYEFLSRKIPGDVHVLGIDLDPILIERAKESNKYPDHVVYSCLNILDNAQEPLRQYLDKHGKIKFDTVFCFSVTMWIHLNEGDDGLKKFLTECVKLSNLLVIEPQPWKCYQTAVKRLKKGNEFFPKFPDLKFRVNVENDIQNYLEKYLDQVKIYETQPTKWKRKICFYQDKYR